jgi:hypothetical protein
MEVVKLRRVGEDLDRIQRFGTKAISKCRAPEERELRRVEPQLAHIVLTELEFKILDSGGVSMDDIAQATWDERGIRKIVFLRSAGMKAK